MEFNSQVKVAWLFNQKRLLFTQHLGSKNYNALSEKKTRIDLSYQMAESAPRVIWQYCKASAKKSLLKISRAHMDCGNKKGLGMNHFTIFFKQMASISTTDTYESYKFLKL